MRPPRDERLYTALVIAIMGVAALSYLSSIPRNPIGGAFASPAAAKPAGPGTTPHPRTAVEHPEAAPGVGLSITLWPHGPGHPDTRWAVRCPPMTTACRTALARRRLLENELPGPCPSLRRGAAEAVVVGWLGSHHVVSWLDQRDGCGSARWRGLHPLLAPPAPAQVGGQTART